MFYLTFLSSFSLSSLACSIVDYFYPQQRIKIEEKRVIIGDYLKMIPLVSFNLLIAYPVFKLTEINIQRRERYSQCPIEYFLCWLLFSDILFFTIHFSFHKIKYLYDKIHSIHHQYKYTYGLGAIYAHPLDFLLANLVPTFTFVWLYPPSDLMAYFIILFSTSYTVLISHSGFKFVDDSHLKHHLFFKKNYGLLLTDKVLGTHI